MFKKLKNCLIIGIMFFFLPSCEFEVPNLSIQERKLADSIHRSQLKDFRLGLDTVCMHLQDSLLPIYIDSMYKARTEEIERQLERVRNSK